MSEYPTSQQLSRIKSWKDKNYDRLLARLHKIWQHDYGTFRLSGKNVLKLELHTGGWSGNESIIGALRYTMSWFLFWTKSEVGGHYYFTIKRKLYAGKRTPGNLPSTGK